MINFKVVTPDGLVWNADVEFINLKTSMGEITVLPNHIPLVATLAKGIVKIKSDSKIFKAECFDGVLEVKKGSQAVIISSHCSKFMEEEES